MPRILVIDDDVQIRDMLKQVLDDEGYDVVVAQDGAEGLRLHKRDPFDLIITDIIMPEKEGLELISELRRNYPDVKIIAMSGGGRFLTSDYLGLAKTLGAMRTLAKPIELKTLIGTIRELL